MEDSSPVGRGGPGGSRKWLGPLAVVLIGLFLLRWTWGKWFDPMVDFGRELYVPWQIVGGQHLYHDMAYFNGPLSPYWNALGFGLFGVGIDTLVWLNIVILTASTILLYRLVLFLSNHVTASTASIFFLTVFAFGHLSRDGNYNFIAPYSQESTHGSFLALACLTVLFASLEKSGRHRLLFLGALMGLLALTKSEFLLATTLASAVALVLRRWDRGTRSWAALSDLVTVALGASVVLVTAFALMTTVIPVDDAFRGILGSWNYIGLSDLHELRFYKSVMGTLELKVSLSTMALWTGIWLLALSPGLLISWAPRTDNRRQEAVLIAASLLAVSPMLLTTDSLFWVDLMRPLPLFLLGVTLILIVHWATQAKSSPPNTQLVAAIALCLYGLLLLLKILFFARFHHYGFSLTVPGATVLIIALTYWVPVLLERRSRNSKAFRVWASSLLLAITLVHLQITARGLEPKVHPVGSGRDRFLADEIGPVAQEILARLDQHLGATDTLAVLPEGVMLNYLSRRVNPTGYINFMPPELIMFGENQILAAFQESPPDFIVLTNRGAQEYGFKILGRGYGEELTDWIERSYSLVEKIDFADLDDRQFSFALLLRYGRGTP